MRPRVIDENTSHELRGDAEKLRPVLPTHAVLFRKLQEKLIYEGGRLQRVFAPFAAKIGRSKSVQFVINKRHQLVACLFLAPAPPFEELRDAFRGTSRHWLISFCLTKTNSRVREWAIARRPVWL